MPMTNIPIKKVKGKGSSCIAMYVVGYVYVVCCMLYVVCCMCVLYVCVVCVCG